MRYDARESSSTTDVALSRWSAPLTSTERWALTALSVPTAAVLGAFALDGAGWRITPTVMAPIVGICAALVAYAGRRAVPRVGDTRAWTALMMALTAWLVWLARPALLPLSTGPDLTHHLLLIDYIEQHWRLVHDPSLARQLGEMAQYTPGSHVLAALAGAWTGTDGLRAFHSLQAVVVALETGCLLLITLRLLPVRAPKAMALVVVPLLLAAPRYMLGGFTEYAFFAQVVAEVFVIAAWWIGVLWDARPDWRLAATASLLSAATFLTWPVYAGPPMLAVCCVIALRTDMPTAQRARHLLAATVPFASVAVAYMLGRLGWLRLAGTGGSAPWPSVASYSLPLILLAVVGLGRLVARREGRSTALFVAAVLAQTLALYEVATRSGAPQPYMALKMGYLLLRPMAVCGSVAIAWLWVLAAARVTRRSRDAPAGWAGTLESRLVWAVPIVTMLVAALPLRSHPQLLHPKPPAVSAPLYDTGRWVRANLPAGCIEYLVGDDETAYWLHLAVLRNPRMSDRTGDNATYEPTDAVVRWLTPGGLPYAIADLTTLPSGVRDELDIVHRDGSAVVAKRRGASNCATP